MADLIWHRIDKELQRRSNANLLPNSWASLGRSLSVSAQVMTNWKSRGVPPKAHAAIASALQWSIDELLGIAGDTRPVDRMKQPGALPEDPPADFADRRNISDSDWADFHAFSIAATPEEKAVIRQRAAWLDQKAMEIAQERAQAAKAKAKTPNRTFVGGMKTNYGDIDDEPQPSQQRKPRK